MPLNDTTANNAIVESLGCGIPIFDDPDRRHRLLRRGASFSNCENNDDDALHAELVKFLDDPALCNQVGLNSRKYAEDEISWPLIADRHLEFYDRVGRGTEAPRRVFAPMSMTWSRRTWGGPRARSAPGHEVPGNLGASYCSSGRMLS